MSRFEPRHVVLIVIALCAAAVLAPVSVAAAVGSLVNISDPVNSSYKAHVTSAGELVTVQHPNWSRTVNYTGTASGAQGDALVGQGKSPTHLAITQVTVAMSGQAGISLWAEIDAYRRTSGSGTCGGPENGNFTGFSKQVIRFVALLSGSTVSVDLSGSPVDIAIGGTTGAPWCLIASASYPSGIIGSFGITGFTH